MSLAIEEQKPPLLVRLPHSMKDFLDEQGYVASNIFENRTAARLRVRCESTLRILSSPPFVRRSEQSFQVLIKDLSKNGIGLFAHLQVYPLETFWLELLGRRIQATVVRCRKIDPFCFEVGGLIASVSLLGT
jgi:hypothetical protein